MGVGVHVRICMPLTNLFQVSHDKTPANVTKSNGCKGQVGHDNPNKCDKEQRPQRRITHTTSEQHSHTEAAHQLKTTQPHRGCTPPQNNTATQRPAAHHLRTTQPHRSRQLITSEQHNHTKATHHLRTTQSRRNCTPPQNNTTTKKLHTTSEQHSHTEAAHQLKTTQPHRGCTPP